MRSRELARKRSCFAWLVYAVGLLVAKNALGRDFPDDPVRGKQGSEHGSLRTRCEVTFGSKHGLTPKLILPEVCLRRARNCFVKDVRNKQMLRNRYRTSFILFSGTSGTDRAKISVVIRPD